MKNLKLYLIIFAVLFVGAAVVTVNIQAKRIKYLNSENLRIENNQFALLSDARQQTNLYLREKEVTGKLKRERDSLAASLKIKPKQIEKIVYIDNFIHDTIKVNVQSEITGRDAWKITDKGECFKWQANAFKRGDSLNIQRTLFEYDNRTTQTFYKKRPHKFLFIRYGKWQYLQKIDATCGEVKYQNFVFTK